jgi:hypothetical protein
MKVSKQYIQYKEEEEKERMRIYSILMHKVPE